MEDQTFCFLKVKVFVSNRCTIGNRCNIGNFVITVTAVLNNAGSFVLTDIRNLRIIFFGEDVAGDIGRILASITERTSIKTTGCDLDLLNAAIFGEFDLFCTTLTGVPGIVRMSVIEDVPVTIDLDDASVVIRTIAGVLICRFIRIDAKVAVADDYTAGPSGVVEVA